MSKQLIIKVLLYGAIASALLVISRSDNEAPIIAKTWTNRVQRVVTILSSRPVETKCPECGGPNHHAIEVQVLAGYDQIYTEVTFQSKTNQILVGTGPSTNWVATNIIYSFARQQPGNYMPPPLPISTNR